MVIGGKYNIGGEICKSATFADDLGILPKSKCPTNFFCQSEIMPCFALGFFNPVLLTEAHSPAL
jgi:hypothetical protein